MVHTFSWLLMLGTAVVLGRLWYSAVICRALVVAFVAIVITLCFAGGRGLSYERVLI